MTDLSDLVGWLPPLLQQTALEQLILAQAAKPGGGGGGVAESLFGSMMLPLMATLLLMYFLLMRPDQRKRKEAEKLLANLKTNDHVVTIGGICGVVVNLTKDSVTIRVDDKTGAKLKVLRSAISRIGTPDEAAQEEAKETK